MAHDRRSPDWRMERPQATAGLLTPLICAFLASLCAAAMPGVSAGPFFVFGSSFADTGNVQRLDASRPYPWEAPYGETWPGSPSGRYSNGHVLTDLLAVALNLSPPISFSQRTGLSNLPGFNFATGGAGVLTAYGYPAISSQIDSLKSVISSYTSDQLTSAVVLYATAGDDYLYSLTVQNTSLLDIYPLTVSVGKQISTDLINLYNLGLRKFAVTSLPPIGCFPVATETSFFHSCNDSWNTGVADPHNARVLKNINGLKHYFTNGTVVLLDLYSAFSSAISSFGSLRPCCVGTSAKDRCGSVDPAGGPLYSLCGNPNSNFFWDDIAHPTDAGWQAVVSKIQSSLSTLL